MLRGIAACLVLAYHVVENSAWKNFPLDNPFALLVRMGWVGVDLFLVISGFVIGRAAMMAAEEPHPGWRRHFMERRLRRIAPLYFLTCLVCLLLINQAVVNHGWRIAFLNICSHLGFIHNLNPYTMSSINGPNWSVALEMQFYLLAIVCAPWLRKRQALLGLGLAVCCAWIWRYLGTLIHLPGAANPHFQFHWGSQLVGTLDQFACGIVVAWVSLHSGLRPGWRLFAALAAAALLVLWGTWTVFWLNSVFWNSTAMIVWWRSPLSVGFALLIAAIVYSPVSLPKIARPFSYLGQISYGLYLWHLLCVMLLLKLTELRDWSLMAATFGSAAALAAVSWHFLEKPIIKSTEPTYWSRVAHKLPFFHRWRSWS